MKKVILILTVITMLLLLSSCGEKAETTITCNLCGFENAEDCQYCAGCGAKRYLATYEYIDEEVTTNTLEESTLDSTKNSEALHTEAVTIKPTVTVKPIVNPTEIVTEKRTSPITQHTETFRTEAVTVKPTVTVKPIIYPTEIVTEKRTSPITQQITITTENWDQYFEVRIINNAKKNNFGDYGTPKDFSITFKLFLKDEYAERLASIDVSIELSYDSYVESYSYDSLTGNYTLTGERSYFMEKYTHICTFTDNDNNYRNGCYFSSGCWGGGDETTGYITRYPKNINASRAVGTITLLSD